MKLKIMKATKKYYTVSQNIVYSHLLISIRNIQEPNNERGTAQWTIKLDMNPGLPAGVNKFINRKTKHTKAIEYNLIDIFIFLYLINLDASWG